MKKHLTIKNITRIAILGSLAGILMVIDFPIFIAPSFYKFDFSDLPCLIGAFAMGAIPSVFIEIIKIIVKLLIKPTSTAYVGEIASFLFSSVYCISATLYYKNHRNKKGAFIGIVIGSLLMVVLSAFLNYYFIIPSFRRLYNISIESIIKLGHDIIPIVHTRFDFVILCVVPFNMIKVIIIDVLTFLLYKRLSTYLK